MSNLMEIQNNAVVIDNHLQDEETQERLQAYKEAGLEYARKTLQISTTFNKSFTIKDLENFLANACQNYIENAKKESLELAKLKYLSDKIRSFFNGIYYQSNICNKSRKIAQSYIYGPNESGWSAFLTITITQDDIENYKGIPPVEQAKTIAIAQSLAVFDKIKILDIEVDGDKNYLNPSKIIKLANENKLLQPVYDPIAVGWIEEDPERFYFICGWDKNIAFENILK